MKTRRSRLRKLVLLGHDLLAATNMAKNDASNVNCFPTLLKVLESVSEFPDEDMVKKVHGKWLNSVREAACNKMVERLVDSEEKFRESLNNIGGKKEDRKVYIDKMNDAISNGQESLLLADQAPFSEWKRIRVEEKSGKI